MAHGVMNLVLKREKLEWLSTWRLLYLEEYLTDEVEIASHGGAPNEPAAIWLLKSRAISSAIVAAMRGLESSTETEKPVFVCVPMPNGIECCPIRKNSCVLVFPWSVGGTCVTARNHFRCGICWLG